MLIYHLHAEKQMGERNISKAEVERVMADPDEILSADVPARKIAQKIVSRSAKKFLYRVIYREEKGNKLIITVYRTTKIRKYLRGGKK